MADPTDRGHDAPTRVVPHLTLAEYLSPKLFPLTAREGMTAREQFRLDAADLDRLREELGTDTTPTERQWLVLTELEDKAAARPALIAELESPTPEYSDRNRH